MVGLGFHQVLNRRQVETDPTCILGLKGASLQFNDDIAAQLEVVEQQIKVEIIATSSR
jgi:hypothetical protein